MVGLREIPVIRARPPIYDRVAARFPIAGRTIFFAYNGAIYAPAPVPVSDAKRAHEKVHLDRQAGDADGWWDRYLDDAEFRLKEEVLAHAAEYRILTAGAGRPVRRQTFRLMTMNLAMPIYGPMVTKRGAEELLKKAIDDERAEAP